MQEAAAYEKQRGPSGASSPLLLAAAVASLTDGAEPKHKHRSAHSLTDADLSEPR